MDLLTVVRASARTLTRDELARPLLAGVSGGHDSLALLHLLWRWWREGGPAIGAVHVDHGLRAASAQDAARVAAFCAEREIPISVIRVDVAAARASRRRGLEDAARAARYGAFARVAADLGARVVALGHQADDQAETVLLHLARGAALGGLGAMRAVRRPADAGDEAGDASLRLVPSSEPGNSRAEAAADAGDAALAAGPALWRPLLEIRRRDVEAYCAAWGLTPLHDATNDDLDLRRNAVRHAIVPAIEAHFPNAIRAIARNARVLAADDAFIERCAAEVWPGIARVEEGLVVLARDAFRAVDVALQARIIRRAWATVSGSDDGLGADPTEAARRAVAGGRTGARPALPGAVALVVDREVATLGPAARLEAALRRRSGLPLVEPGFEERISGPGAVELSGGWSVRVARGAAPTSGARLLHIPGLHIPGDEQDYGEDRSALLIRTWRDGDRVGLPGGGSQKLQDWFVNEGVPRYLRRHLPVLARGARVLWIPGLAAFTGRGDQADGLLLQLERADWASDPGGA